MTEKYSRRRASRDNFSHANKFVYSLNLEENINSFCEQIYNYRYFVKRRKENLYTHFVFIQDSPYSVWKYPR